MKYIGTITCAVISFCLMLFAYAMNMYDSKELIILMLAGIPVYMYKRHKQDYIIAYCIFVSLSICIRLCLNSIMLDKLKVVSYPLTMEQHEIRVIAGISMVTSLLLYMIWILYRTAKELIAFVSNNDVRVDGNQNTVNNKKSYMFMSGFFIIISLVACIFIYNMQSMLFILFGNILAVFLCSLAMDSILTKTVNAKIREASNMEDADEVCEQE